MPEIELFINLLYYSFIAAMVLFIVLFVHSSVEEEEKAAARDQTPESAPGNVRPPALVPSTRLTVSLTADPVKD